METFGWIHWIWTSPFVSSQEESYLVLKSAVTIKEWKPLSWIHWTWTWPLGWSRSPLSSFVSSQEESYLVLKSVVTNYKKSVQPVSRAMSCVRLRSSFAWSDRGDHQIVWLGAQQSSSTVVPGGNFALGSLHQSRPNIASNTTFKDTHQLYYRSFWVSISRKVNSPLVYFPFVVTSDTIVTTIFLCFALRRNVYIWQTS